MENNNESESLFLNVQEYVIDTFNKKMKEKDITLPRWIEFAGSWMFVIILVFGRIILTVFSVILVFFIYLFEAISLGFTAFIWLISWLPNRILRIFSKS